MRGLSVGEGLIAAAKADTISITAWQIGMCGFMALAHFYIFPHLLQTNLPPESAEFWFMMQIAMLFGFMTSYPVNWWLISARRQGSHVAASIRKRTAQLERRLLTGR